MKKKIVAITLSLLLVEKGFAGPFEVGFDWLYWKTFQDNLEYGEHLTTTATPDALTLTANLIEPNFKANSGFRVFVDYNCLQTWQFDAIFTRITGNTNRNDSVDPATIGSDFIILNTVNFFVLGSASLTGPLSQLSSKWSSAFNWFDFDLSRNFDLCSWCEIRPHLGVRGVWAIQQLHLDGFTPLGATTSFSATLKQHFDGYGVESGIGTVIPLRCGFSISAWVNGALLFAEYDLDREVRSFEVGVLPKNVFIKDVIHRLAPMVEGFIGLEYDTKLGCTFISAHIGWEQHLLMNGTCLATNNFSDLTLQGLTLGASVSY